MAYFAVLNSSYLCFRFPCAL